jgi:hypothetical protein
MQWNVHFKHGSKRCNQIRTDKLTLKKFSLNVQVEDAKNGIKIPGEIALCSSTKFDKLSWELTYVGTLHIYICTYAHT